jgi:hypothetical protein
LNPKWFNNEPLPKGGGFLFPDELESGALKENSLAKINKNLFGLYGK